MGANQRTLYRLFQLFCRFGHKSLCRDSRRCLSFHQQRHKLDCGEYRFDEHLCQWLLPSPARISLPGLGNGVFLSTNNGTSWTAASTGLTNYFCHGSCRLRHESLCRDYGGGVFLSTNNGTSWTAVNTGLTNTYVTVSCRQRHESLCRDLWRRCLSFHQQRHKLDCSQYRLDEHFLSMLLPSPARISLPGLGGGVFLSTNNGTSWTAVNTGLTNTYCLVSCRLRHESLCRDWWRRRLSFHQQRHKLDCGQYRLDEHCMSLLLPSPARISLPGLMRRRLSFHQQRHKLDCSQYRLDEHWCLCLLPSPARISLPGPGGGVFLSTNNGTSWTAVNTGLTNTFVSSLAVSGTNLFAGTGADFGGPGGDGVFLSTNNGTSWTAVNTGLTNTVVLALAVSGTNLFAGTDGGVFLSTNNGTSWTAVNTGLTSTLMSGALAVSGTNLFAGTWRRCLSFHQQRHKLDSRQYRLDEHSMSGLLLSPARISLPGLMAVVSFFPPTTAQAGPK